MPIPAGQQLSGFSFCKVQILFSETIIDAEKVMKYYGVTQVASHSYEMKL